MTLSDFTEGNINKLFIFVFITQTHLTLELITVIQIVNYEMKYGNIS